MRPLRTIKKLRLAIVSEPAIAGVKVHVVNLLKQIDTNLFEVYFLYSDKRSDSVFKRELVEIRNRGIRTFKVPLNGTINFSEDIKAFFEIYRLLRQNQVDIVHTHSAKAGFLGRLAARLVNHRIISVHTPHAMPFYLGQHYRYLERFASFFTDSIIAVSESEKRDILSKKILPEEKISVILCGVPAHDLPKNRRSQRTSYLLGEPNGAKIIGTCGRICPQKDPLTFFRAAQLLLRSRKDVFFVWIGDGEDREFLEQKIREAGLERYFKITGWVENPKEYMKSLDVFLLTSLYESFGYVTCEAMLLQKPVVATRVSGTVDIVANGETGLLVPPKSPDRISEAIRDLLEDPESMERMGRLGQARVKRYFTTENCVVQTQELYKLLLKNRLSKCGRD